MKYIKDDAGNLYETYSTPESAINAYAEKCLESGERVNAQTECSFAVAVDDAGNISFCVANVFRFTNCTIGNIKGEPFPLETWYEDEWMIPVIYEDDIPEVQYEYYENYIALEHVDAQIIEEIRNAPKEQLFERIMNLVPAGKTPEINMLSDLSEASVQCDIWNDYIGVRWVERYFYDEDDVRRDIEIYDVPTEIE